MKGKLFLNEITLTNFATFKRQTIEFSPGLNVIIGETGAGKSLILDALQLVFGSRADKRIVRKNAEFAIIEATLSANDKSVSDALDELGYPSEDFLVTLKRIIYKNGTTKSFINHQSCNVKTLSNFSKTYIDLVGQFENQKLLSSTYQLNLLDNYAHLESQVKSYQENFHGLQENRKLFEKLKSDKGEREKRIDYLKYQINEIDSLSPKEGEENSLLKEKEHFLNYERRAQIFSHLQSIFSGDTDQMGLSNLAHSLKTLIIKNSSLLSDELETMAINLTETIDQFEEAASQAQGEEFDQERLDTVLDRLDLYQKIKRKHGSSVNEVQSSYKAYHAELDQLTNESHDLASLDKAIIDQEKNLTELAKKIHSQRTQSASKLAKDLESKIHRLRMDGASIRFNLQLLNHFNENGLTELSFLSETNPGEGFFKVKEIASGGELSRILLAFRQVLSSYDSISIFLFDEIDTGLGGETALHIGKALEEVAKNGQVISISHLPQIAKYAHKLIEVIKETDTHDDQLRTESSIQYFIGKEVSRQLDRMTPLQ